MQSDGLFLVSLELLHYPLLFLFWRFFQVELLLKRAVPLLLGLDCFSQLLFQRSGNGFNVLRLVFELQLRWGKEGGRGRRKWGISNESEKRENDCAHRLVLLEVLFKLPVVLEKLVFLKGTGLVLVFSLKVVYLRRLVKLEHLQSLQMLNFLVLHELLG